MRYKEVIRVMFPRTYGAFNTIGPVEHDCAGNEGVPKNVRRSEKISVAVSFHYGLQRFAKYEGLILLRLGAGFDRMFRNL